MLALLMDCDATFKVKQLQRAIVIPDHSLAVADSFAAACVLVHQLCRVGNLQASQSQRKIEVSERVCERVCV